MKCEFKKPSSFLFPVFAVVLTLGSVASAAELSFDSRSVKVDGRRTYLVSGEFHYFRVPKADWARRLELLKQAGGNCVATYIPWCIHEPEEGRILFGDRPERDLEGFLAAVEKAGLMAIVRPGPYQYSELMYDGLPRWLIEKYPQIRTKRKDGKDLRTCSVDYNHPVFLEKTHRYFQALAPMLRRHLAKNGGCISMVQLDNETTGIHFWFGYPPSRAYYEDAGDFLVHLRDFLAAEGVTGPYCHNAGGATMVANHVPAVQKLGVGDFLLGYDHYYNLGNVDGVTHPDARYFMRTLFANDVLRGFGYAPVGMEVQTGTIGDVVPVLKEDLLACHMANLAAGMRGINYYTFTGGPNFPGSGNTCDDYDYCAPVGSDGSLKPTYESLRQFGAFVKKHVELLDAERVTSVQLVTEWAHAAGFGSYDEAFHRSGMTYSLLLTPYSPENVLVDCRALDPAKPVVLAGIKCMGAENQRKLADFVKGGGSLFVAPDFPRADLEGLPCTVLADAVGAPKAENAGVDTYAEPVVMVKGARVYCMKPKFKFPSLGADMKPVMTSESGDRVYGCEWRCGKGQVAHFAAEWRPQFISQAVAIGGILADLGAKPSVSSSNPAVFATAYRLADGAFGVFALNFRASPQNAVVTAPNGRKHEFTLKAMEVGYAIIR